MEKRLSFIYVHFVWELGWVSSVVRRFWISLKPELQ